MSGTKIEALINHLLTTFPDGGAIADVPVQVIDGPGVADIRNVVLFIGYSIFSANQHSGASAQKWAMVGKIPPGRDEDLDLSCSLRVGIGDANMAVCRAKAIAVFHGIADALRASVGAFSANGELRQLQVARMRLFQELTNNGASVTVEFSVTATARI